MPAARKRPLPALIALLCSLLVPATAQAGDYSVSVGSTTTVPGWSNPSSSSLYRSGDMRISARRGHYDAWVYRRWRLGVPSSSVRIMGGRVTGIMSTPHAAFRLQVRQGTDSAAHMLHSTDAGTSFDVGLVSDMDWVEFGLTTQASADPTVDDANFVEVRSLQLTLRDIVAPALSAWAVPSADRWYGHECPGYSYSAADHGSGLSWVVLTNTTTGARLHQWNSPRSPGLRPGSTDTTQHGCVSGGSQAHGSNSFELTVQDVSGIVSRRYFAARFDLHAPALTTALADGASFQEARPRLSFEATDPASGLRSVTAALDGKPVALSKEFDRYTVVHAERLAVGAHTIAVTAVDNLGNQRVITRKFTIGDLQPPQISLSAPAAAGGVTPVLRASAVDELSDLNPASWTASVDGQPLAVQATGAALTADVGVLTAGRHVIRVSVADVHGNRANVAQEYAAGGLSLAAGGLPVGAASGIFLIKAPREPVTFRSRVALIALAARQGRPLARHRIQLTGPANDSEAADIHGVAPLSFRARRPGRLQLTAVGSDLTARRLRLHVAPRVTLNVSARRPKRGEELRLWGQVVPAVATRVSLEARIESSWYPLRKVVSVDKAGRFETTVTSAVAGDIAIRAQARSARPWSPGTSAIRLLRVRR